MLVFSDLDLIFDVKNLAIRVSFEFQVPKIIFSDLGVHPTEDLMGQLLFEIGSGFDEWLKSPANGSREVISCADGIDPKHKKIRIDSKINTLINNPQDSAIASRNDNPNIGLSLLNRLLNHAQLIMFLLRIE